MDRVKLGVRLLCYAFAGAKPNPVDPMIQSSSESIIVSALRRGQVRRAVGMLVDSYNDDLYAYCASLLGPASGARVYQQALASAISNLGSYQEKVTLRGWLFAIARRTVLDYQREHPVLYPCAQEEGHCPVPPEAETAEDADGADLASLPPATRELLQLRLWHGLRLRDVAFVVDRPADEVRRQASDALALLSLMSGRAGQAPS